MDNSANRTVYPQKADFTFYGGLYRDVHILIVPHSHFALGNHGAPALRVTPEVSDDLHSAAVTVEAACENTPDGTEVLFAIEGVGEQTSPVQSGKAVTVFHIENVHLWDGVADPYLYSIAASLPGGDAVAVHFGCRKIDFKPDTGFWLNGRNVRLVGAARHQDRAGLGNALTAAEHEEDMQLLRDMGANTVRLAHYQHAQYFYNLCDKYGLVAWAEIPYITEHMPEATANTLSQMEELVLQNYNHPSIICWGLSNEITVTTGVTENLTANHRLLNDLCHRLDVTRPTTMAHAFMLDPNDPFVQLPDITYDPNYRANLWHSEEEAIAQMKAPLPLVDILKVSDEELPLLTGTTDCENGTAQLAQNGIRLIFVTLGANGVFYRFGEKTGHVAGVPCKVGDTNGAGDTFFGAALSKLCKEDLNSLTADKLESILAFANKAASITTSRRGAIPAMPTLTEVEG